MTQSTHLLSASKTAGRPLPKDTLASISYTIDNISTIEPAQLNELHQYPPATDLYAKRKLLPPRGTHDQTNKHHSSRIFRRPFFMSTEGGKSAAAAGDAAGSSKPQQNGQAKNQPKEAAVAGASTTAAPAPTGEKKLSGAELKKKAKEEKAARRLQAKAVQTAAAPPGAAAAAAAAAAAKGKGKQDGGAGGAHGNKIQLKTVPSAPAKPKATVPECFSHLSMAKRMSITHADKDVHSVMLQLGQQMSTFAISDSITRAEATLLAFKKVRCHKFIVLLPRLGKIKLTDLGH